MQPTSPCPQHGCTPDKTLPHESDNEDGQCADTDPIQDEAPANIKNKNDEIPMSASANNVKQEMSPLPDQAMYLRPNANKQKYKMSATMENFCAEVLPHMVLDGETHTHDLDETMYGGTLTVQDKEVSYGEVVFGKPDAFFAPLPHMFPLSGNDGKSNMFANAVKWSFPFLNKVRRMRSIDKLVAGMTDISQLQKDVVRDSKGMKGHLNLTYNDVKENEEPNVQSEVVTCEEPPVKPANGENSEKVNEHPDDTKDSLFSGKNDALNESDYFGSQNESDLESVMGSPVFTVKQPLALIREEVEDESVCDTSNEVIAPTQMRENSDPISTVGLVEVDNLSSPVIPSGQVPPQETTMTAEEANAMDSSQDADDNIVCPDNDRFTQHIQT